MDNSEDDFGGDYCTVCGINICQTGYSCGCDGCNWCGKPCIGGVCDSKECKELQNDADNAYYDALAREHNVIHSTNNEN